MAKHFVANMLNRVIDRSIQVHGALGYSTDTPLAHMYQHARWARFADGADEVHQMRIAQRTIAATTGDGRPWPSTGRGGRSPPMPRRSTGRRAHSSAGGTGSASVGDEPLGGRRRPRPSPLRRACFAGAFVGGRLLGRVPSRRRRAFFGRRPSSPAAALRGRVACASSPRPSSPRRLLRAPAFFAARRPASCGGLLRRRRRRAACAAAGGLAVAADAGGREQHVDLVEVQVDHVPQVGDQLAAGDEAELELVEVAVHRDVEAHALGDRRHRDVRAHLGAVEVQRLARAGDVGDDHVDRRRHAVGQLEAGGQADRRRGDDRRRVLLDVDERLGRARARTAAWPRSIASRHAARRSSGSARCVGRSTTRLETRFVHGSSSSPVRIDTGTIARSGRSGRASCSVR